MKTTLARKVFWTLLGVAIALVMLHLVFQYLNLEVYHEKQGQIFEISNRVDLDDEVSIQTWFSQFILLAIGLSALLAARFETVTSRYRLWKTVGIVGILLSLDEVGSIHEFVLQSAHLVYYGEIVPTAALNAWWLALPFIAVGGLLFSWWIIRNLPRQTVVYLVIGGIIYLTGAAGFELVSNDVAKSSFLYQGVMTAIEESLELIGSITILAVIVQYIERYQAARLKGLAEALSRRA